MLKNLLYTKYFYNCNYIFVNFLEEIKGFFIFIFFIFILYRLDYITDLLKKKATTRFF